jgi:hypothetical protein
MNHPDQLDFIKKQDHSIKTVDGLIVFAVGKVEGEENTFAVSVPPLGSTRYFCSVHKTLFKIGAHCPECGGTTDGQTPVVTVVTVPASPDNAEKAC